MADPAPAYPPTRGDERAMLESFLDAYRREVLASLDGLDDDQAARFVLPATSMTVGGIVKHLAQVEDLWFRNTLLGAEAPQPWASVPDDDPDWGYRTSGRNSVAQLRDLYVRTCERSRAAAAQIASLGTPAALPSFGSGPVSFRWILVHMIEETARHAGHLDLLRDALLP